VSHARCAALAALAMTACASDTLVGDEPRALQDVAIAPFEFHEECAPLHAGDRIDYRFEAKAPVDFEIYYQDGLAHVAPVSRAGTTADSGIFPVPAPRRYCLRWEAGQRGALLDLRVRVLRAAK
jgi:hypothetical protein